MKARSIASFLAATIAVGAAVAAGAQSSKEWVDIKDPKELKALYSNKTFRGKAGDGSPFVGHYRADGKGILIWNNQPAHLGSEGTPGVRDRREGNELL
jgi:hypothetical protein